MWRLAQNHALGSKKRFVVETDQQRYQVGQTVTLKVDARNAQYNAISENDIPGGKLSGQWVLPAVGSQAPVVQALSLSQVQPGRFTTRFVVTAPGEHKLRVIDPITQKPENWSFTVFSTSVERQHPTRDENLQRQIASESEGRTCDLKDVQSLLEQVQPAPRTETSLEVVSLVNTWVCFVVIAGLLLIEWLLRKRIGLP
jgi:hypothetical protein